MAKQKGRGRAARSGKSKKDNVNLPDTKLSPEAAAAFLRDSIPSTGDNIETIVTVEKPHRWWNPFG